MQGNLPDSDDYMYLDQVLDWLKGQSWFDNIQQRLDPPHGVLIVFSRLTELPIAALIWLLKPFLGAIKAAIAAAAIIPPLLFALLLITLRWSAEIYMDKSWTRVTAFIVLFAAALLYQFSPGHVDHHGLTALLVLAGFGCATRMITDTDNSLWPLAAGLVFSFALTVGLEILPPLVLMAGWIGMWAMTYGKKAARCALLYGLSLFICSALFLIITTRPTEWSLLDPLRYSAVYIVLTGGISLSLGGIFLAAQTPWARLRYIAGFALALITAGLFFKAFPALITGPYGAMNTDLARVMFASITEAQPLIKSSSFVVTVLYLIWPLMGLAAAIWFFRRARNAQNRWLWSLPVLLIAAHILLGTFYQIRFMVLVQLFCVIPVTAALHRGMIWIGKNCKGRAIGLMELGLLLLAAPFPMMIVPAIVNNAPLDTGILMFPVATAAYECDMRSLAYELNHRSPADGALIMNEMESGPELLFRTSYSILGAPFHTDVQGNLDAAQFFSSAPTDDRKAEAILRRRHAAYVTLCRKMVPLYRGPDNLAGRLNTGKIPAWLKPVHYIGEQDYLLFEVKPAADF